MNATGHTLPASQLRALRCAVNYGGLHRTAAGYRPRGMLACEASTTFHARTVFALERAGLVRIEDTVRVVATAAGREAVQGRVAA